MDTTRARQWKQRNLRILIVIQKQKIDQRWRRKATNCDLTAEEVAAEEKRLAKEAAEAPADLTRRIVFRKRHKPTEDLALEDVKVSSKTTKSEKLNKEKTSTYFLILYLSICHLCTFFICTQLIHIHLFLKILQLLWLIHIK